MRTGSNYIDDIEGLSRKVIEEVIHLHLNTVAGRVSYSLYFDYYEFANYQMAELDTVILLANERRYREAFIILRSVFEHAMLFSLMTRANRYFFLYKKKKRESDETAIARLNKEIDDARLAGKKFSALRASKYPLGNGVVKVVHAGPYMDGKNAKGNLVPYYVNIYKNFSPKDAFLQNENYFRYTHEKLTTKVSEKRKKESKYLYTHYMSYAAMKYSLFINGLLRKRELPRLDAHYNFLSEFVHPTKEAIDRLKASNRTNPFIKDLAELREDRPTLKLMIILYAGYLASWFGTDLSHVLKNAPKKYFKSVNMVPIETAIDNLYNATNYFWFVKNEPHEYDKFYHCVHEEDARLLGGDYNRVANGRVKFRHNVLTRFNGMQAGWNNVNWGSYKPPFDIH